MLFRSPSPSSQPGRGRSACDRQRARVVRAPTAARGGARPRRAGRRLDASSHCAQRQRHGRVDLRRRADLLLARSQRIQRPRDPRRARVRLRGRVPAADRTGVRPIQRHGRRVPRRAGDQRPRHLAYRDSRVPDRAAARRARLVARRGGARFLFSPRHDDDALPEERPSSRNGRRYWYPVARRTRSTASATGSGARATW